MINNELKVLGLATVMGAGIAMGANTIESNACGVGDVEFEVTATMLNVRTLPNTSSNSVVIGTLKKGQKVVPFEAENNGAWGKIKMPNGKVGWICMSYMKSLDACDYNGLEDSSKEDATSSTGIVTASTLNVRAGAGTNYRVKAQLTKGSTVSIKSQSGNWYHIQYRNNQGIFNDGYVSKAYISKNVNNSQVSQDSFEFKIEGEVYNNNGELRWFDKTVVVPSTKSLNVRQLPSVNSSVVTKLKVDSKVAVSGNYGLWYRVKGIDSNGSPYTGWVHSKYLR